MMKNRIKIEPLVKVLQILLGIAFLFSGFSKIFDLNLFAEALRNFKLLTDNQIEIVKFVVPIIEIILGMGIIFNFKSSMPSFCATLLLSFFTAIIVVKILEGQEVSCGCFGALSRDKLDEFSVLRNIILILISGFIAVFYDNTSTENNTSILKKDLRSTSYKFIKVVLLYNIFFFLAVQNFIFALQNNGLKSRLSMLTSDHDILKKDEVVESFHLYNLDSTKITVNYNSNPNSNKYTLLFLLKPTCSPCKLNVPNWTSLYKKIDLNKTRVFPISLDSVKNTLYYKNKNRIPFPIFCNYEDDFMLKYKAFLTPQTILIDKSASVVGVWKGLLNAKSANEIVSYLTNKKGGVK